MQAQREIKALIFDFHGVLSVHQYWQRSRTPIFSYVQNYVFVEKNAFVKDWMLGHTTSEQICSILAKKLKLNYEDVWSGLVDSCNTFALQPGVLNRIRDLRTRMPVFLVTTNMDCFSRFVAPNMNIESEFDKVLNSSDVGLLKEDNDGEIFRRLAIDVKVPLPNMLLLDDSINVGLIFKKMGGHYLQIERGPIRETDFGLIEAALSGRTDLQKIICGIGPPETSRSPEESARRLRA